MGSLPGIGIAGVLAMGALWLAVRAIRWAKKGTRGGKMLMGVMFLYPDQPPPNERIEQQIRLKKDAGSGDPLD